MRRYQEDVCLPNLIKEEDRLVYTYLKQLNSADTETFQCYRSQICVLSSENYVDFSQV